MGFKLVTVTYSLGLEGWQSYFGPSKANIQPYFSKVGPVRLFLGQFFVYLVTKSFNVLILFHITVPKTYFDSIQLIVLVLIFWINCWKYSLFYAKGPFFFLSKSILSFQKSIFYFFWPKISLIILFQSIFSISQNPKYEESLVEIKPIYCLEIFWKVANFQDF